MARTVLGQFPRLFSRFCRRCFGSRIVLCRIQLLAAHTLNIFINLFGPVIDAGCIFSSRYCRIIIGLSLADIFRPVAIEQLIYGALLGCDLGLQFLNSQLQFLTV